MESSEIERVDPWDADRCQSTSKQGQCSFKSVPGSIKLCPVHIGGHKRDEEKKRLKNYRLSKWQNRVSEFSNNTEIKSLREEIGITRMILEETVTMCQDSHQLLLSTNKISDLVLKIEKLVSSCHRIEKSTGQLLGKTAILNIATQMMEIMGSAMDEAVKDPDNTEQFKNDAADSMIKMILDYQSGDDE